MFLSFSPIVPSNYTILFTANVYFARLENTVPDMTIVFNFTVVARNSHFNGIITSIVISVIGTRTTEGIFRLSDGTAEGTLLRTYSLADPEFQIGDIVITFSGSIIMLNDAADPVPSDIYDVIIGAVAVGVADDGQLILEQTETLGLILVPAGEFLCVPITIIVPTPTHTYTHTPNATAVKIIQMLNLVPTNNLYFLDRSMP